MVPPLVPLILDQGHLIGGLDLATHQFPLVTCFGKGATRLRLIPAVRGGMEAETERPIMSCQPSSGVAAYWRLPPERGGVVC